IEKIKTDDALRITREQARVSESQAIAASANTLLTKDPELALLLAREAARINGTPLAEEALRDGLLAFRQRKVLGPAEGGGSIQAAKFLNDGSIALLLHGTGGFVWKDGKKTLELAPLGRPYVDTYLLRGGQRSDDLYEASSLETAGKWILAK